MNDPRLYFTEDTSVAAYLFMNGFRILPGTVIRNRPFKRRGQYVVDPRRRSYVFLNQPQIKNFVEEFFNRTSVVKPLEILEAEHDVKRLLRIDVDDTDLYGLFCDIIDSEKSNQEEK